MLITASKLRENIYNVLDNVLETGIPVEIQRRGKVLKIVCADARGKLINLKKHDILTTDLNDIVHMDWSDQWKS